MVEDGITKFVNSVPFFKAFSDVEKTKIISRGDCFEKYSKEDVGFKIESQLELDLMRQAQH